MGHFAAPSFSAVPTHPWPLFSLSYTIKGPLDTPYYVTTSSKPSPPHFHCIESTKLLLICLPVLSSHWLLVLSLVPDDLANQILSIFPSRCTLMSSTTYPNITPIEEPMRPEHHSPWLLPDVCTHPVCMTVIFLIILLCCEVYLMHQVLHNVFPDVLRVWEEAFYEIDHDATRNVIDLQFATTQPYLLLALWSIDQVNSNLTHVVTLVIHFYTIISEQVLCQFIQSIVRNTYVFPLVLHWIKSLYSIDITFIIYTWSLPWFYFF
jgi:hypothetical protein